VRWVCKDFISLFERNIAAQSLEVNKYELTKDGFNNLIEWLADSGKDPGEKYEEIRSNLIKYFSWNGCHNPEELADEAINIVAAKFPQLAQEYEGDPARYFLGVARNLVRRPDTAKLQVPLSPDIKIPEIDYQEELSQNDIIEKCKQECLHKLSETKKKLIFSYYKKGGKHDETFREILAAENNMPASSLRVTVHRIRQDLKQCFGKCKEKH